jgi:hypothetical protein
MQKFLFILFLLLAAGLTGVLGFFFLNPDPLGTKPLVIRDQYAGETIWVDKVFVTSPSFLVVSSVVRNSSGANDVIVRPLPPGEYRGIEIGEWGIGGILPPGLYTAVIYEDSDEDGELDEQTDRLVANKNGTSVTSMFHLKQSYQ